MPKIRRRVGEKKIINMEMYKNLSGNSPITHFEIGDSHIIVWFKGTKSYRYSYNGGAGRYHVEQMKLLAKAGQGLSAYITNNVRYNYDK